MEEGCKGIIAIATDGKSYSFGCDYVPFTTTDPPTYDSVKFTRKLPTRVTMSSSATIIFNSRGQVVTTANALTTLTLNLYILINGSTPTLFNTGTLRPTGFFSYAS